jgi:hypothetical protein
MLLYGLGAVRQFAFVVNDIRAAMNYWTSVMGVGPFFSFEQAPVKKPQIQRRRLSRQVERCVCEYWVNADRADSTTRRPPVYIQRFSSPWIGRSSARVLLDDGIG